MGGRVLLAAGASGDEVAAHLRDGGFEVERCGAARLARGVAEGDATLVVLAWEGSAPWGRAPLALPWIALCAEEGACAQALEAGAEAALVSPALLVLHARRAAERFAAQLEQRRAAERRAADDAWVLLGSSAAVRRLEEGLARVASTPRTTVLVRGRPGAPLDELARLVHARSSRSAGPLIELEAAGVPAARWDEVCACAGGSLIVREVTGLDAAGQAALLEQLEPRAGPDGGGLRLIATTCGDLPAEVESGRLREDLAYRLNVLTLALPPLAERREDLGVLAAHLAARAARQLGRAPRRLEAGLLAELARRPWPGDLLELSLYMTARELLGPTSLPLPAAPSGVAEGAPGPSLGTPESLPVADRSLRALEEALIRRVLEETGGNKLRAAEILGIHRTTLYHKLAAYGLDPAGRL
jgi:DNA-binding NtrC family response regulator